MASSKAKTKESFDALVKSANSTNKTAASGETTAKPRNKETFDALVKNANAERVTVDNAYISRFAEDANNYFTSSNNLYSKMSWDNADSISKNRRNVAADLNVRSSAIRNWLNQNKNSLTEDAYRNISDMLDAYDTDSQSIVKSFDEAAKNYAQFDSQEAYDSNVAYWQDYAEKGQYDTATGEQEIAELEAQLAQLKNQNVVGNTVNTMPYAAGSQAATQYAPVSRNANGMPYAGVTNYGTRTETDAKIAELERQIQQKRQYLNQSRHIQKKNQMESATGNADFNSQSVYVASEDDLYNWINDERFREQYEAPYQNIANPGARKSKYARKSYDQMTADEVKLFNYYYATEGAEKAQEYLDTIQEDLNRRAGEQIAADFKGKMGAELFYGASAGLSQFDTGMTGAGSMITGKDDYIPQSRQQFAGQAIREDLGKNGGVLAQGAYDLISTTANMAPSILASAAASILNPAVGGYVGSALMGTSAAGNAYQTALNAGYDKNAARSYGVAIGVAETAMQSILGGISSLGGISPAVTKAVEGIDNGLLRFFARYGAGMASEGLEEGLQEILDPILQNALLGADESVDWANVAYSALLGALSSGVLEFIPNVAQSAQESRLRSAYDGKTDDLIAEGISYGEGEASELAQKYKSRTDGGKSLNGAQIKNLLTANEKQQVEKAARERLTELGETDDPAEIAKLATKRAMGEMLKPAEKSRLARSKFGSQVAKELDPGKVRADKIAETMARPGKYKPLDSRVEADVSERVSDKGKNEIVSSGKQFDLKQLDAKTDNSGKMVWTVDGDTVSTDDIKFADEDTAHVVEAVSQIENISATAAPVLVRSVDMSEDVIKQLNGLDEAYTYGYHGYTKADLKAGEFTSELTETQMMDAFRLGEDARKNRVDTKVQAIKKMRTAAEAEAAKGKSGAQLKITYDHGKGNIEDFTAAENKVGGLDKNQRAAVEVAKMLHELGLGTDFEFFKTYLSKTLKDPKTGKRARVFLDANGNEVAAYAGVYTSADGKIRIDLNAYNGSNLALNAMSHELVHFIQDWSPDKYKTMAEFLASAYGETGMSMHQRVLREQARLQEIRGKDVPYAEAYDEVVANALNRMFDDGTIMEKLAQLRNIDASLAEQMINKIRELVDKLVELFNKNQSLYHDTDDLMQMRDTFKKLQDMFAEALVEASDNLQAARDVGFDFSAETESFAPVVMMSEQTWQESDYVQQRDTAAQEIAKAINVSVKKAKAYIDSVNSIAKMIAEDRTRLDYFSSPYRSSFVSNSEYGGSFDFSTLCKKRRLLTGTFTAIQKALPNTALTADEILDIRNRMKDAGLEVSCGLCYVEGSRANMGQFAKEFLKLYKQYNPDAWQPNMADVNTPDGIEWVRINHPECYEQYEYFWNHYGTLKSGDKNLFASQQKPKLYQLHTEYKGEILKVFKGDEKVEEKNRNGGIRLQSFSDFEIVHLIDTMQIIMDMARVGLAGQAYTKVPDFAWALGDTGLKINLSLIAKGVDADGNLIFDNVEGMPIKEAMKLRERYSQNVGTILVAFNDEQLKAAMADERVDFIIPFHRSQWKKSQYEAMGLPAKTKDYTYMQNEKFIKPQYHEYRGRMVQDKATNYMPNEYWDFSKSGKENAEAYLEMCARNNKRPKFYKLLQNNGDGSYSLKADGSTDGYWKLLIDFKMYDNNGVGSPQMAVRPEFNMDEANRMLNEYQGGHSQFPVAQGIVDSFVSEYKESHKGQQFSSQETDLGNSEKDHSYEDLSADSFYKNADIYSYDFLVNQKPMVIVENMPSLSDVQTDGKIDYDKVVELGLDNVKENGGVKKGDVYLLENSYTGRPLQISKNSITHGLGAESGNAKRTNARLGAVIGQICKNAIPINGVENTHNVRGTYVMASLVDTAIGGEELFIVALVNVEQQNGVVQSVEYLDVAHALSGRKLNDKTIEKENRVALSPRSGTKSDSESQFSTINISDLLVIVNSTHQGYLSDDVIKSLAVERRGPKKGLFSSQQTDFDADGNELSEEQVEFFAKAETRDEDGNLVMLYHTSPTAGFYTFEGEKGEGNYKYKNGEGLEITFFTDGKKMSSTYARNPKLVDTSREAKPRVGSDAFSGMYKGYANITKPYVIDAKGNAWKKIEYFDEKKYAAFMNTGITDAEKAATKRLYETAVQKNSGYAELDFSDMVMDMQRRNSKLFKRVSADEKLVMSAVKKLTGYEKSIRSVNDNEAILNTLAAGDLFHAAKADFDPENLKASFKTEVTTNFVVRRAIEAGIYDGVIIKNVKDYGANTSGMKEEDFTAHNVYVTFHSDQFKAWDNRTPTKSKDMRYSTQETDFDSEGRKLTEDQLEYFADSKARDKKGNLYVLFHGSRSPLFTEFDTRDGVWLTPDQRYAEVYAEAWNSWRGENKNLTGLEKSVYADPDYRLYKLYANITNPLDLGEINDEFDMEQMNRLAKLLGVPTSRIRSISHSGGYQNVSFVYEVTKDRRFIEIAKEKGYDGFTASEKGRKTFCAFNAPNQVKLTTNEVPSGFHDIRYSTQQTDNITNRDLLANAFETISRSSAEYEMVQDYKRNITNLNKLEDELSDVNVEIRRLRFGKDVERDPEKLRELEQKAKDLDAQINKYDKRLVNMEASGPLQKLIERERKKARQKSIEHTKQIQQNRKLRKEQTELRKRIRRTIMDLDKILNKGDKKRNVKEGMRDFASKALASAEVLFTDNYSEDDMIRNGVGVTMEKWESDLMNETRKLFDQIDLIYKNAESTGEVDRVIAGDTQSYEARMKTLQKLDQQIAENKRKLKGAFARERVKLNETTISTVLNELANEYRKLGSSDDLYIRGATNEDVYQHLLSLSEDIGGTVVKDMTLEQLEAVHKAYKMVLTTVRKANQMFNKEIKESVQQMGSAVIGEVQKSGGVHGKWTGLEKKINEESWNNTKPIWIANRIKSATFEKLMHGLFEGQYQYAVDVDEAKKYKQMADRKFKPRKWDAEKLHTFKTPNGEEFQLNLQQIMSLYAYSKREQSYSHLLNGGFVFSNQTEVVENKGGIKKTFLRDSAKAYKLNQNVLSEIIGTLSDEQKAYVDSMQAYLSETMGAKGNEVSMEMLGVKLFNEKFYFPLRSSGAYMEKAKEAELKKQQGQINIASSGFTHSTKPEAKNPVILDGFLDVWAEHCVEMSMYHSMVLPMEDFRRVYNYKNVADTEVDARSVFQTIQDAYGSAATNYIDQLYRELNAGATVDPRETSAKARISKFKKSAVMLSNSVVVQQFSAIGRAFDIIDPKFFAGAKVKSTKMKAADEMKKYAPVAVIKEIGGFDTGIKGSAKNYIMAESYDKGERFKGFMSDEQYRGDITGFAPAKADEITWTAIWEAAKRETHAKNPKMDVESEAFLDLAGNRFSEAIEKTQVYDSVLARSANMRSKSALMSMATAFMAEPTTTINLLEDAIRSKKAKNIARAFGSVAASIVLNNALASVVYAMRDDDEDETFVEKYFQSFVSGMIDDSNPMAHYPYLKDVYSLFQGYDVERADMSVITDLRDAVKKAVPLMGKDVSDMSDEELSAHWKSVNSVIMSVLDAGFAMFGVPEKNVRRDAASIINTYKTIRKDITERDTTWMSFWDKVGAAAKDTIPVYAWTKDEPKTDALYKAIMAGDTAYQNRIKNSYKDEKAYTNAVSKALRENDPRIQDAAQALYENNAAEYKRIYQLIRAENKFTADDIRSAIDSEASSIKKDTEGTSASSPYSATDFVKAVIVGDSASAKVIRNEYISFKQSSGYSKADAEKKFEESVMDGVNDAYKDGMLSRSAAKKMLIDYAGKDADEAEDRMVYWEFKKNYPQYNLSDDAVWDYYDIAEPLGIKLSEYASFINGRKGITTQRDASGKITYSSRDQTVDLIHSLNLTADQKDALYIMEGYSKNKLYDTPWH